MVSRQKALPEERGKIETLEMRVNFLQMQPSNKRYRGLWTEVATSHKSSKN